jgi:hypothetical protein
LKQNYYNTAGSARRRKLFALVSERLTSYL